MIGIVDCAVQCQNPNMPLHPMRAFVSSPTSIRVRNVPKRIGKWAIESVQFVAAYPDGSIKTANCVLTGGVWVGTIEGTSTSGTSTNGYTIYASGTDENGNAVTGYILGKGDIEILEGDGTITPGEDVAYVHLLDEESSTPKEGDLYPTDDGYMIWQDGEGHLIGDDSGAIEELQKSKRDILDMSVRGAPNLIDSWFVVNSTRLVFTDDKWEGGIYTIIQGEHYELYANDELVGSFSLDENYSSNEIEGYTIVGYVDTIATENWVEGKNYATTTQLAAKRDVTDMDVRGLPEGIGSWFIWRNTEYQFDVEHEEWTDSVYPI